MNMRAKIEFATHGEEEARPVDEAVAHQLQGDRWDVERRCQIRSSGGVGDGSRRGTGGRCRCHPPGDGQDGGGMAECSATG